MSAPGDEKLESAATAALLPNVEKIKTFFELARSMEQVRTLMPSKIASFVPRLHVGSYAGDVGDGRHEQALFVICMIDAICSSTDRFERGQKRKAHEKRIHGFYHRLTFPGLGLSCGT